MMLRKWCLKLAALAAVAGMCLPAARAADRPNQNDLKKINAALPDKAPAKAMKPRKVLVYTLATGFVHSSIPVGAKTFELMGKKTGAYETVVTNDPLMFAPDKLKQFDAVILVSTTGDLFDQTKDRTKMPAAQKEKLRKSFLDFVRSGKGVVGIHAATDSSYGWKEYGLLIGGYFNGHPWGKITMKLDDPSNPINACFHGEEFTIQDEIYTFRDPYSRNRLHLLTSIDLQKSGITRGENRKDHDYAVSWIHRYGKGRVFYCSLGHREETFWNPVILKHYLAGTQYALGDLECNDAPSGTTTSAKK